MWQLFQDAKTWNVRPSELVDIDEPYLAYCFDTAVADFGNDVVAALESVEGKTQSQIEGRRKLVLKKKLGKSSPFKNPTATGLSDGR